MSNIRRYFEEGVAYFVTTITRDRKPLFLNQKNCRILLITVEYYKAIFDYSVLGYCLMPDHFHLIIKPGPRCNVSDIMKMVKGSFTRKINKLGTEAGSMWQRRFFDQVIRNERQLMMQLNYMHQNPVLAGLVSTAGDYPYSSHSQYEKSLNPVGVVLEVEPLESLATAH